MGRQFTAESCVFIGDCIKHGTEKCCDPCWRQREYFYLLDNSNLPDKYKIDTDLFASNTDLNVFKYLAFIRDNIIEFVENNENLYISGVTGCGKTTWACKILRKYIMEVSIANGFIERALFINLPNFIVNLKHNISQPDAEFQKLKNMIAKVDLVVWDDIGATNLKSDFTYDEIYAAISYRIEQGKSNIYTGNLNQEELGNILGDRLTSRIFNFCQKATILSAYDIRHTQSRFSSKNFLKEN